MADMRETIERRIEEFLAEEDPRLGWLRGVVGTYRFLPLNIDWAEVRGIRPDGSFVCWEHELLPERLAPEDDPWWQRMALCEGAKKYPELRALLPPRPPNAVDCEDCGGTGRHPAADRYRIVCSCGGVGWVIPGAVRTSRHLHADIDRWIDDYLENYPLKVEYLREAVQAHRFLPLYIGWNAVLGIRRDGMIVRFDTEPLGSAALPELDPYNQRWAICQGRKKYPELEALIPPRPPQAVDCEKCHGTGEIPGWPQTICDCGGIGWVISGEMMDRSVG